MSDLAVRLWDWLHTHEGRKVFRYSMVSVISTAVSFFVLFLVYGVFRLWSEVPSTIFANCVATFPSYWLNRHWAWGKSGRSHLIKEVIPFWAMSGIGIAVSIVGATLAREFGQAHHLNHFELTVIVLLANVMSFGVFWVLKLLLFNRMFHVSELEEIEEVLEAEEHSAEVHAVVGAGGGSLPPPAAQGHSGRAGFR
jgi:putative flippase GtrA